MTTKTIDIIVAPNGETRIETRGFSGPACQEASRLIEQALGSRAAEQRTAEFYAPQTDSVTLQQPG